MGARGRGGDGSFGLGYERSGFELGRLDGRILDGFVGGDVSGVVLSRRGILLMGGSLYLLSSGSAPSIERGTGLWSLRRSRGRNSHATVAREANVLGMDLTRGIFPGGVDEEWGR